VLNLSKNNIEDITPLRNLTKIGDHELSWIQTDLNLYHNQISDISPLLESLGINKGDRIDITYNPLNSEFIRNWTRELLKRGVFLTWHPIRETSKPTTTSPSPTTPPPTTTPKTATPPPTTTPVPTVAPASPTTTTSPTPPSSPPQSNFLLYIGIFVAVIVMLLATYQIIKKPEPEKVPQKEKISPEQIEEIKQQIEEKKKYIENYKKIMERDPSKKAMAEKLIGQYEEEIKELERQVGG